MICNSSFSIKKLFAVFDFGFTFLAERCTRMYFVLVPSQFSIREHFNRAGNLSFNLYHNETNNSVKV